MAVSYSNSTPRGKKVLCIPQFHFNLLGLKLNNLFATAVPQKHLNLGTGTLSPSHCASVTTDQTQH